MARRSKRDASETPGRMTAQGVELMDLVIRQAQRQPRALAGYCGDYPLKEPHPIEESAVERLRFPSGRPLPPSLQRWLAFDASWLAQLGWFESLEPLRFSPRPLDQIVRAEFEGFSDFEAPWSEMYAPLGARLPECFLLPDGSDSRRIFAVSEPDALGEYPVLVVDTDDLPYTGIMYPGLDVYFADKVGLIHHPYSTYEALFDDSRYASRLNEHARHLFGGKRGIEIFEEEWGLSLADGVEGDAL